LTTVQSQGILYKLSKHPEPRSGILLRNVKSIFLSLDFNFYRRIHLPFINGGNGDFLRFLILSCRRCRLLFINL